MDGASASLRLARSEVEKRRMRFFTILSGASRPPTGRPRLAAASRPRVLVPEARPRCTGQAFDGFPLPARHERRQPRPERSEPWSGPKNHGGTRKPPAVRPETMARSCPGSTDADAAKAGVWLTGAAARLHSLERAGARQWREGQAVQRLNVTNASPLHEALEEELRHSPRARYLSRLHCLLFIASGHSCIETARALRRSARAIEYYVHRYQEDGVSGLAEQPRGGAGSRRLTAVQYKHLCNDLAHSPRDAGYSQARWHGPLLATHLARGYGVRLSVRQCQRLIRQLSRPAAGRASGCAARTTAGRNEGGCTPARNAPERSTGRRCDSK